MASFWRRIVYSWIDIMSAKREKERRRKRKLEARRFAAYLDTMETNIWIEHKRANPHVECNADFQAKIPVS